jgi:hypothetical protein
MPCGTKRPLRRTLRGCIDFSSQSSISSRVVKVIWQIVPPKNVRTWQIYVVFFAVALLGRVSVAHFLANDEDQDGDLYAQIASNVLEHHIYSRDTDPPFAPTLVRLPGYPPTERRRPGRPRTSPLDPIEQARVRRQRHRESKRNAGMVPAEIWLPKAWRDAVIARGETLQDAAQKAFQLLIAHWKSNQAS